VREATSGEYVVEAEALPATVAAVTAWLAEHQLPLADLRAGRQTLEDVFLRLTSPPVDAPASSRRARR
jgi:ABC-2 type transport system ATP-binding protein